MYSFSSTRVGIPTSVDSVGLINRSGLQQATARQKTFGSMFGTAILGTHGRSSSSSSDIKAIEARVWVRLRNPWSPL